MWQHVNEAQRRRETVTVRRLSADEATALLDWRRLPRTNLCAWATETDVLVGWGRAARLVCSGPDRIDQAARWWTQMCRRLGPATNDAPGAVAFGSLGFSAADPAVMTVPAVTIRVHEGVAHLVQVDQQAVPETREPETWDPVRRPDVASVDPGRVSERDHLRNVSDALEAISHGVVRKVVLSRDLRVACAGPPDERHLLRRLRADYPSCAGFAFEGLIGASPERLLLVDGRVVTSVVLGGSAWPDTATPASTDRGLDLADYAPARSEFAISAAAVTDTMDALGLQPLVGATTVMRLPNVAHFATTIRGTFPDRWLDSRADHGPARALRVLAALHPTPAVCGDPPGRAAALIAGLEGRPRGGYAAPVGWIDTLGDGDWWIALRSGQLRGSALTITAGGGVVDGTVPRREIEETSAKLRPLLDALVDGPTADLFEPHHPPNDQPEEHG